MLNHPCSRRAFTLIELIIVVSIIGILAAIVLPKFSHGKDQAAIAALASNVQSIQSKAAAEMAKSGDWPTAIDPTWFAGGEPDHPQNTYGIPMIQTVEVAGLQHPVQKMLGPGGAGAYWYNTATGAFRARVSDQGSEAATLKAYNEINGASETAMGNYGGGGGGS